MKIVFIQGDYYNVDTKNYYVYRHTISNWKRKCVNVIWINDYVMCFRKKLCSMNIIYIVKQKNLLLTIKATIKASINWIGFKK